MTRRRFNYLAAAIFLLLLSLQPARASTWSNSVVDNTATATGKDLSVAVDPNGKLYLGYMDTSTSGSPYLKYANNVSGSWYQESLKNVLPNASDISTATVFTPGGPRIMAYSNNAATGRIMYQAARKINGDGWQLQDIGGGINPMNGSAEPAMTTIAGGTQTGAVQYMGFTFITFNNGNGLKYANERDMAWYDISATGMQSDLAVDSAGNVHVVYVDASGVLQYVENPKSTTLGDNKMSVTATNTISNPAIGIDGSNTIHLVYTYGNNKDGYLVWYISKTTTGAWSAPVSLGSYGSTGGYAALKVDSANNVHVVWNQRINGSSSNLIYREKQAGTWLAAETVPAPAGSSDYGQYAALAIDQYNTVNIAYYDASNSSVNVVTKANAGSEASPSPLLFGSVPQYASSTLPVTLTSKGTANLTIGAGTPISITGSNASEFSISSNGCTPGLSLAPNASCSIGIRFSPTTAGDKTATLNIASNDSTVPARTVTLKGTTNASVNYTIYTAVYSNSMVPGIGGTISPSGVVTATGGLNQSFSIVPNPGYLIAGVYLDGTSPSDFGTPVGAVTSYTFTEVNADHNITAVFYPVVPVTSWSVATVDNSGTNTGKYCSMAVNPTTGKLYVGYLDNSAANPVLKLATNVSGSWGTPETIPIPDVTNAGTATVYTPAGPRVMAYTYNASTLKRKYMSGRKWFDLNPANYSGYPYFVTVDANLWQLQDIAGGFDPMGNPQPGITNTTTDTFTGAVQYCASEPCGMNNSNTFISYTDGNNLWYANERDMYYHEFEPTLQVAGAGKQSDLALDSQGHIHIVYYNPTTGSHGRLMYAENPTALETGFQSTNLTDTTVSSPAITVDNNDILHVVYVDSNHHLQYINKQAAMGGTWSAPYDLGTVGTSGAYTSIKANGLDIVHVAFYSNSGTAGQVMYAQRSPSGSWTTPAPIPDSGTSNYGQYAALVVDSNHNVNIAYYDVTNTSLKVATKLIPVISATPAPVSYGSVAPNTQTAQTVTVKNVGQAALSVGTASITGTDATLFTITANGCANVSLAPAASCSINVTFSPVTNGAKSATLHIPSNDPYTSDKQVVLSGTAISGNTVSASASAGGTITPSGQVLVPVGGCQVFTMTPDSGFSLGDVEVNNVWTGSVASSYSFCPTQSGNTIYAWFDSPFRISGTPVSYFGTLEGAFGFATSGNVVQAEAVATLEDLLFSNNYSISLFGGYDYTFTTQTGETVAKSIVVSNGTVEMRGMVFK